MVSASKIASITLALVLASGLCSCAPRPLIRAEVHNTQTTVYAPVPEPLTSHGTVPEPKAFTCGAAVEVAQERKTALRVAYAKLDAIAKIQGTPKESMVCPITAPTESVAPADRPGRE